MMARSLVCFARALSLSVLTGLTAGCVASGLPERESPPLEPSGTGAVLDPVDMVYDLRRDGIYSALGAGGWEVRQLAEDGSVRTLASLPVDTGTITHIVSRSDSRIALAMWDRLYFFDGNTVTDWTDRLMSKLILAQPTDLVQILGLDMAEDGRLDIALAVGGQGGEAPYGQLCTLSASGESDLCEGVDHLQEGGLFRAEALVVEGERTYLLGEESLFVREGTGAFDLATDLQVAELRSLEGGRVAFVGYEGMEPWALHVLGANGAEERSVEISGVAYGHSLNGLWSIEVSGDWDSSNCGWSVSSSCSEPLKRTQLVVYHMGEERVEVGHLDREPGIELFDFGALAMPDGSLHLEVAGSIYPIDAP